MSKQAMSDLQSDPTLASPSYSQTTQGDYTISTDPALLDVDAIHGYLSRSYWATGRPRSTVEESLRHSLNFGVYQGHAQVGLARVITDYTLFAYLCDVYILEEHQGHGLGKWLLRTLIDDPALHSIRRFMLATRDAHSFYAQFGFTPPTKPELWMERIQS
jgi:GNAT superfamily N-acetyltransferase